MAFVSVNDYEQRASELVQKADWDFYRSGACECTTVESNRKSYQELHLVPKCLQNVSCMDLSTEIFGAKLSVPLGISPTAAQHLAHPEGELANARAAEKAGVVFTLSTFSSYSIEEIAAAAPNCTKWLQLYIYEDHSVSEKLIRRAEDAGFKAIVITVDSPQFRVSYAMMRRTIDGPAFEARLANFEGAYATDGFLHKFDKTLTFESGIRKFVEFSKLPVIAKGILRAEDAVRAVEAGCRGVIVSNHGGRNVDTTPPTIQVLPEVVDAVGGRVPIIIDGGIRLGTQALKALAIGADLVFMGRAALWGLAVDGQKGVEHVLQLLSDELRAEMMLCGVATLKDITRDIVVHESVYKERMKKFLERCGEEKKKESEKNWEKVQDIFVTKNGNGRIE